MIKKSIVLNVFIWIFSLILFTSYLEAGEITSVDLEGYNLKIKISEKFEYKIIPQEDPFKIKIELYNTEPGILKKKMLFHEGIVSEVSAHLMDKLCMIEILLSEPIEAEITSEGENLVISFDSDKKADNKITADKRESKIIDILMEKSESGYEISILGDGDIPEPKVVKDEGLVNLIFSDVVIDTEPSKDIPVFFKKEGNKLLLSFQIEKGAEADVMYFGDEILLKVNKQDTSDKKKNLKIEALDKKIELTSENPAPKEKTISLDLQDADLVGAFRLLADAGGYNLVVHPNVRGKVTLKLKNIPILKAFDIICRNYNLIQLEDENFIRIIPADAYLIELVLEKRVTKIYKLKHVRPSEIIKRTEEIRTVLADARIFQFFNIETIQLQEQKDKLDVLFPYKVTEIKEKTETERSIRYKTATEEREEKYVKIIGIAIDERTGSLVINAPVSMHKIIEDVIAKIDVPQKQVLFEARIIEVSSSFSKSLGFEWGIRWSPPDSRTTIVGSQAGTIAGGTTPVAINLPASTGNVSTSSSAFTLGYINASGTFALDLRISALQQSGKGKVVANPKIIVMDNQIARITQGETVPYAEKVLTETGYDIATSFKDIGIALSLTPRIIDEENLNVYLYFEKEELIGFREIATNILAPQTVKLSGSTEVKVKDGETLVLGGIYKKIDNITDSRVPGLGDIPLVGELFKKTGRDENIYEVLIFITPRILKN